MNRYLKLFGMLLTAFSVNAQNYTLQQCIDYALQNEASYQNSSLDVEIAKAKVGEIRGIGLPQVNASGTFLDNINVQKAFLPSAAFSGGTASIFQIMSGSNDPNISVPATQALEGFKNQPAIMPLGFGVRYSNSAQISVTQLIFDGSYIVGLQASKTFVELSQKSKDVNKADLIQKVKKAYLSVLVSDERKKMLELNIARLDSNFRQLSATNKAGLVEGIDVDRLEVQLNNMRIDLQKVNNFRDLSVIVLKFQMGMPFNNELILTESLESYKSELADIPSEINYDNKPEFSLLKTMDKANKLELKSLKYGKLPTLAAFGNLGANTGSNEFGDIFKDNYYNFTNVGLSLSIPIFDGTQRHYKISAAKLKIKKNENNMSALKNAIYSMSSMAKINFENNKKSLESQEKTVALAKRVLDVSQKKYDAGVGSSIEVVNAEADYKTALLNYYTLLHDALINKVDYDYAVGNLK